MSKTKLLAVVLGLAMMIAAGIGVYVFAIAPAQAQRLTPTQAQTIAPTQTQELAEIEVAATITASPEQPADVNTWCRWTRVYFDEPELSADLRDQLMQYDVLKDMQAVTVKVKSYGETCGEQPAMRPPGQSMMSTDVSITLELNPQLPVDGPEAAYTILLPPTQAILETLAAYPDDKFPSSAVSVTIDFYVATENGPPRYYLSTDIRTIKDLANKFTNFHQIGGLAGGG